MYFSFIQFLFQLKIFGQAVYNKTSLTINLNMLNYNCVYHPLMPTSYERKKHTTTMTENRPVIVLQEEVL